MSAFLGPIHFWLYNKIRLQEDLISAIAGAALKQGWIADEAEYVNRDDRALEELIDEGNIHGWLQERIHDCEGRYAQLVTAVTQGKPERMEALEALARDFGRTRKMEPGISASDAFQKLEDSLLNGMPCDRVNVLKKREENEVAWERTQDLHSEYWVAAGGDPNNYESLTNALIAGLLEETEVCFVAGEGKYHLFSA